MSSTLEFLCVL